MDFKRKSQRAFSRAGIYMQNQADNIIAQGRPLFNVNFSAKTEKSSRSGNHSGRFPSLDFEERAFIMTAKGGAPRTLLVSGRPLCFSERGRSLSRQGFHTFFSLKNGFAGRSKHSSRETASSSKKSSTAQQLPAAQAHFGYSGQRYSKHFRCFSAALIISAGKIPSARR